MTNWINISRQISRTDRVCINNADFTELSKSINSMFYWYEAATRCYVYLADVPGPDISDVNGSDTNNPGFSDPASKIASALSKSRWFKRGWTLQELIAPKSVQFFSRKDELLGDKRTLGQQIHQITGVAMGALQGKPLDQFSEEDRLSWAARREKTVEEDAAYCMLGIFNIHMPLIRGEGREKAPDRLRRKIQKYADPTGASLDVRPSLLSLNKCFPLKIGRTQLQSLDLAGSVRRSWRSSCFSQQRRSIKVALSSGCQRSASRVFIKGISRLHVRSELLAGRMTTRMRCNL